MKRTLVVFTLAVITAFTHDAKSQNIPTEVQDVSHPCWKKNWDFTVNDPSTTTTWTPTTPTNINTSIIVPNGQTLIINGNSELRFAPGCGIIVEVGGILNLLGSPTLTSCDASQFWQGIDVAGTLSQPQTSTFQGLVSVSPGVTLSRAMAAIEQVDNCNGESGGIIQVDGATFLNNLQSVIFHEWEHATYTNESFLINSDITITSAYGSLARTQLIGSCNETVIEDQVVLTDNNGVRIYGCDFENLFNTGTTGNSQLSHANVTGSAIYAQNSDVIYYNATGTCPSIVITGNYFFGWYQGIISFHSVSAGHEIEIIGSTFMNNRHGIYISNCESVTVIGNELEIDSDLQNIYEHRNCAGLQDSKNSYGVFLRGEIDQIVYADNTFEAFTPSAFTGLSGLVYEVPSSFEPSSIEIQGNSFTIGVDAASGALAVPAANGVAISNYEPTGDLVLECNTFDMNADPTSGTPGNYRFYDFRVHNPTGTTVDIGFGGGKANAANEFTPYSGCVAYAINHQQYNLWSNGDMNYTASAANAPTCTGEGTTAPLPAVNITIDNGAATCATYDYCHLMDGGASSKTGSTASQNNDQEEMVNSPVFIYPVPAHDQLMIESEVSGDFEIVTMDGRIALTGAALQPGSNVVNISSLPSGTYLLRFVGSATNSQHQFVKE